MPHCELCGKNVNNLIETEVSGATLHVCSDCTEFGKIINNKTEDNKTTKYNTNKSKNTNDKNYENNSTDDNDYFENVNDLSINYGDKIRQARNDNNYTREELSNEMNIKQSHLRNIEDETTQPDVQLQNKLENVLNIDLSVEI